MWKSCLLDFPSDSVVKNPPANQGSIPGSGRSPEEDSRILEFQYSSILEFQYSRILEYSSILAWKITWTEEPGCQQPMGLQRIGHDWAHTHTDSCLSHLASNFYRWTFVHLKKKHWSYSLLEKERKIILQYKYEAIFQF